MTFAGLVPALAALATWACLGCGEPEPGADGPGNADGHAVGDALPTDADQREWEPVDPCCISPTDLPPGSVRCNRENPECPPGYPFCCTVSCGCYYMFEESGCCRDRFCGTGACREAPVEATRSLCPLPEPQHRCPAEQPHCCSLSSGLAYCSDHELHGWLCGW